MQNDKYSINNLYSKLPFKKKKLHMLRKVRKDIQNINHGYLSGEIIGDYFSSLLYLSKSPEF